MKRILTILFLFTSLIANGQGVNRFANGRTTDTAYTPGALRADGNIMFNNYSNADTNRVASFDIHGNLIMRVKGISYTLDTNFINLLIHDSLLTQNTFLLAALADSTGVLRNYIINNYYTKTQTYSQSQTDSDIAVQIADTIAKVVKYKDSVIIYVTPFMLSDTSLVLRNYFINKLATVVKYLDSGVTYVTPFMLGDSTGIIRTYIIAQNALNVKYTDTAAMLAAYRLALNNRVKYSDSITIYATNFQLFDTAASLRSTINSIITTAGYATTKTGTAINLDTAVTDSRYWLQGGNTPASKLTGGTKNSNPVSIITNNVEKYYVDSNGNTLIGSGSSLHIGGGTNNIVSGNLNVLKGQNGTRDNSIIGARNNWGDSSGGEIYNMVLGSSNTMYNHNFSINYAHVIGNSIILYLNSNSFVPSFDIGSFINDSVNNVGQNFGQIIFGNYWRNRHAQTFFIGTYIDSANTNTNGYTSMEKGEMVIASPEKIKLMPSAHRDALWINTNGNSSFGDTSQHLDRIYSHGNIHTTDTLKVDKDAVISGKATIKSLTISYDTTISANYTFERNKTVLKFNTGSGNQTHTLQTSNYSVGDFWIIQKSTTDSSTITINPSTGTINGSSSITFSNPYQAYGIRYNSSGNYDAYPFGSGSNLSLIGHLTFADFGIFPDLKRTWMSFTASSHTVTAASGTFSASDVGKVVCLHKARTYLAYTPDSETVTGTITAYTNSSTVTIDSLPTLSGVDSIAYFGANQYNAIQTAITFCNNHNIGLLWADGAGTYLVCPKLSSTANGQTANQRGFQITNSIVIRGAEREGTYIKWSVEDDDHIDSTGRYQWQGFVPLSNADFHLWDITLLSPDRYTHDKAKFFGTAIWITGTVTGAINLRNVDIIGDSLAKNFNPDWKKQWGYDFWASNSTGTGRYDINFTNVRAWCDAQNVSYFITGNSNFTQWNTEWHGSGSVGQSKAYLASATVKNGNDTVTVRAPGFSWYYMTSNGICNNRFNIKITDGVHTYNTQMATIVNDTVCVMNSNAANAYTLADLYPTNTQNLSQGEGQMFYGHDTVGYDWHYVTWYGAPLLSVQTYSAGSVGGSKKSALFDHCRVRAENGWPGGQVLPAHTGTENVFFNDCDSIPMYSIGYSYNIYSNNTIFRQAYVNDTAYFLGGGGNIEVETGGNATVIGGDWNNSYLTNAGADTIRMYGGRVNLATNTNNTNGYFATFNTTHLNSPAGAGTVYQYPKYTDTTTNISSIKRLIDTANAIRVRVEQKVNLADSGLIYATEKGLHDTAAALRTAIAGGGVSWGGITGTLSSQTDLQTALNGKVATTTTVNSHALSSNVTVTQTDVGLGNVDNTSDATKNSASVSITNHSFNNTNTITGLTMGLGSDATGDLYTIDASKHLIRLGIGGSANLLLVNGGAPTWQAMSGDVTIGSTGITAIGSGKVTNAMLAGSIDLTTKVTGVLPSANGGTGVNNGTSTFTIGGNFAMSGAFGFTGTVTATTAVTYPTSGTLATLAGTETFTNKRITARVGTTASGSTITPTGDASDMYTVTALAAAATIAAPSGTPTDGQVLILRIKDNGTARALTWNAIYRANATMTLPTTTTLSKTQYDYFIYNAADSKWDFTGYTDGL